MPNIILKIDRREAVELFTVIHGMEGEANYKAARQQVQKNILSAWPEAEDAEAKTPIEETRDLDFNPKHQRALAEGFLSLANNPKTTGRDFDTIEKLAGVCRVWGWVHKHIEQKAVPDFEGELDGEPELLDAEKSA